MALATTLVYAANSTGAGYNVESGNQSFKCSGGETILVYFNGVQNFAYGDVGIIQPDGSGRTASRVNGAYNPFFSSGGTMGGFGQFVNAMPGTYTFVPPQVFGGSDGIVRVYIVTGAPQGVAIRTYGKLDQNNSSQTITVTTVGVVQVGDLAFGARCHENTVGSTDTITPPAGWTDDIQYLNGSLNIPTDNCHLLITSGGGSTLSATWTSVDPAISDTSAAIIVLYPNPTALTVTTPASQVVSVGQFATFTTTAANNSGTVSYQWTVNGVNVGTNSPTLVYQAQKGETLSTVVVTATDSLGSTFSFPAYLRVIRNRVVTPRRRRQSASYDNDGMAFFKRGFVDADYFDPSTIGPRSTSTAQGVVKVWNGTSWVTGKPRKVWNGSAWVSKPAKYWSSATSSWITCT